MGGILDKHVSVEDTRCPDLIGFTEINLMLNIVECKSNQSRLDTAMLWMYFVVIFYATRYANEGIRELHLTKKIWVIFLLLKFGALTLEIIAMEFGTVVRFHLDNRHGIVTIQSSMQSDAGQCRCRSADD
jgi:hypothetical protein